jgi:TetR/AcrR family transcriptional repressor of nem operon
MGHSQAEKTRSHERILSIASRRIREGGLDGISVGELMKAAGLTHGGFYGHFDSRDALLAQALERALAEGEAAAARSAARKGAPSAKAAINSYLSPAHRDDLGGGCAYAALAADLSRAGPDLRGILTGRLARVFERMEATHGGRQAALAAMSTMLGALILARAVDDEALSNEILRAARDTLIERSSVDSSAAG